LGAQHKNTINTGDKIMLFWLRYIPLVGVATCMGLFLWDVNFYSMKPRIGEYLLADVIGALLCLLLWYTFRRPL